MRTVRLIRSALLWSALFVLIVTVAVSRPAAAPRSAADGGGTRLLRTPTVSATHIAFAYASNIWVVDRAGGRARRITSFQGDDRQPAVLAGRQVDCVQRRLRRQPRRLRGADRGGRAETAHLAPRQRPGARVDARRQAGRLRLRPRLVGAGGTRASGPSRSKAASRAAADASRLPGHVLARRQALRLPDAQLVGRGAPELPRRPEPSGLDRRSQDLRPGRRRPGPTPRTPIRSGSARHGLLHLRPRRGPERLELRHEVEEGGAGHLVQRLRREVARRRRRRRGVRAGRVRPRTGPEIRPVEGGRHHRDRRLPVDDAALEGRDHAHDEPGTLAHRQAGRLRKHAGRSSRCRPRRATSGT